MVRRRRKPAKNPVECVSQPVSKQVTKSSFNLPKPRILVLRNKDHPTETMGDVPLSQLTNVINNVAGKVNSIQKLRNGTVLIETKTENQSVKLMKLKFLPPKVPVKVSPHRWLNYSKGIVKCWDLNDDELEELKSELRSQSVVNIRPIMTTSVNEKGQIIKDKSNYYVLTFTLPTLPKTVYAGFLTMNVTPFIPQPKMCYRCFKYGHIAEHCRSGKQLCRKCNQPGHMSKNCISSAACANCPENYESGHSTCISYMIHRKILEIDCLLKNIDLND